MDALALKEGVKLKYFKAAGTCGKTKKGIMQLLIIKVFPSLDKEFFLEIAYLYW